VVILNWNQVLTLNWNWVVNITGICTTSLNATIANIASLKGVNFIDVKGAMDTNGGVALISGDGIHPNNLGHKIIAQTVVSAVTGTKYNYTQFHQDISTTGVINTGVGISGGGSNGLEIRGTNEVNGSGKISMYGDVYFNKNILSLNSGVQTTPKFIHLGAEYTSAALNGSNLQIYTYSNTGIGTSSVDGLGLYSIAGTGARITSYQDHYFKGSIFMNYGASGTTFKALDLGAGVYTAGASDYSNALIKMYLNTYIGVSATEGLTFGSGAGSGGSKITFKNNTYFSNEINLSDTVGAVTTPASIKVGLSTYAASAISVSNTTFKGYGGSGMGFNSSEGLVLISGGGLTPLISLKNPTAIIGTITATGNATIGSSLSGAQTTPSFLDLGLSYANATTTGSSLKLKLYTNTGIGVDGSNGLTLLSGAGTGNRITSLSDHAFSNNLYITNTPTTSAGTYDFLTRNTSTGQVEKILSSSIATQTALNLKSDLASPTFTGVPIVPTATAGTSTTQAANTLFVQTEISNNTVGKVTTPDVTIANGATVTIITLASNASYLGHITYLSDKTRFKSIIFGVGQEGGTTQGALSIINDPAGAQFSISMTGGVVSVTNASGASQTFRIVLSKIGF
jgi:hypothetical protein